MFHGLRQVRPDYAPRTHAPDARFTPPPRRVATHDGPPLRPLLPRTLPLLLHRRLPHARFLSVRPVCVGQASASLLRPDQYVSPILSSGSSEIVPVNVDYLLLREWIA